MTFIQLTGWTVHHITHEVSLSALLVLLNAEKEDIQKPKGILAGQNLDVNKLKDFGFGIM